MQVDIGMTDLSYPPHVPPPWLFMTADCTGESFIPTLDSKDAPPSQPGYPSQSYTAPLSGGLVCNPPGSGSHPMFILPAPQKKSIQSLFVCATGGRASSALQACNLPFLEDPCLHSR